MDVVVEKVHQGEVVEVLTPVDAQRADQVEDRVEVKVKEQAESE